MSYVSSYMSIILLSVANNCYTSHVFTSSWRKTELSHIHNLWLTIHLEFPFPFKISFRNYFNRPPRFLYTFTKFSNNKQFKDGFHSRVIDELCHPIRQNFLNKFWYQFWKYILHLHLCNSNIRVLKWGYYTKFNNSLNTQYKSYYYKSNPRWYLPQLQNFWCHISC